MHNLSTLNAPKTAAATKKAALRRSKRITSAAFVANQLKEFDPAIYKKSLSGSAGLPANSKFSLSICMRLRDEKILSTKKYKNNVKCITRYGTEFATKLPDAVTLAELSLLAVQKGVESPEDEDKAFASLMLAEIGGDFSY